MLMNAKDGQHTYNNKKKFLNYYEWQNIRKRKVWLLPKQQEILGI
jgi:hypothetical protein